ncbi:NAD(P)/FAD-dependent oxidoreductase [Lichenibacterium dinghuense]|uniref:NAD(P)/FAD-dependent oxidoreductase n=1 Tax=Lichenibacterium dinghuense TaxID=2895977 RepID=UPI001F48B311|nr:FAD-dependent oxidoreductase [Lichenibacterium sp. 6Y81]
MDLRADVVVLGAGIVGVSAALHLQERGRDVALVERAPKAGMGTSYGNAGLIERSSIYPYAFPRDLRSLLRYATNRTTDAHYHPSALPGLAPFLVRYWFNSSPKGVERIARAARPLIERSMVEHERLMKEAGATELMRRVGWIKGFRSRRSLDKGRRDAARLDGMGLAVEELDAAALAEREPHLGPGMAGALHFRDPGSVSDPGLLVERYAALFRRRGGRFLKGDAATLEEAAPGWRVKTRDGWLGARDAVVALGPWSDAVFGKLGYRLPFGIKRGYHMHFRARGNAVLNHTIVDVDGGYLLAPMDQGIRLTTGAEFARRDAPMTPVQLERALPTARSLFPLAEALEDMPWMGSRPCLPDMLPVIGRAPKHDGLWFDFGHQHHGLTLGPVSGRLLAEQMAGETPFTDPAPYRIERFG